MLDDNQIYIIVDMEMDGKMPGENSVLSLAAVASTADEEVDTFYRKLLPVEGLQQDEETMTWWQSQPDAWKEVNTDAQPASAVMQALH